MTYMITASKPPAFVQPVSRGDTPEIRLIGLKNVVIRAGYDAVTREGE